MKRIVICSNGTWGTLDRERPTNVTRMARAVLPSDSDGTVQIVFYDAGVDTEGSWLWRRLAAVSGNRLEKNIRDCYRFLVHNFELGDEIYLFGFSRGAYTVRSLAGMVRRVGILRKSEADRFQDAYRLYRCCRDSLRPGETAAGFRAKYSSKATVAFMGVWDTVGVLGIPVRGLSKLTAVHHRFHDVRLSEIVERGCHALAIDETRSSFEATPWKTEPKPGQVIEQVWFPGGHSDIGGDGDHSLSAAPFEWMKGRASVAGLALDMTDAGQALPLCPPTGQRRWLRSLLPSRPREMGLEATESVHPTARDLYCTANSYAPENLAKYLDRPGARIYGEDGS